MSNTQTYFPDNPVHPGAILADTLEFLSLSVSEAAERMEVSQKHLSNIINGKSLITAELALKLEKITQTPASTWTNLSSHYQGSLARIDETASLVEESKKLDTDLKETYKELMSKDIVPKLRLIKSNYVKATRELLNFFAVNSLHLIPTTQEVVYRRYEQNVNKSTVAAVIRLGERKAQSVTVKSFDKKKLKESLPYIKSLSLEENYFEKLEEKLAALGIVLVCVPGFAHTGLQGACKWLDVDKAMIILKADGQTKDSQMSEDKFWFNLFHEIGHLLLHGKSKTFIDLEDDPSSDYELEADKFAQQQLMPKFDPLVDLNEYKRQGSIIADLAIPDLAKKYDISPSIVAGRLSYSFQDEQGNVYSILNKYKKQISYTNYEIA